MSTEPTVAENLQTVYKYYPEIFPSPPPNAFLTEKTYGKLTQGKNLSTSDIEQLLKDPHSQLSRIMAFNFISAVVSEEIIKIKQQIADQEAREKSHDAGKRGSERPDQQLIHEGDIEYSKQLLKRIEDRRDTSTQEASLLKGLYEKLDNVLNTLAPIEKAYREDFNALLTVRYKDYFTEEEKQTYTMTSDKQEKLHKDFYETKENLKKLNEMIQKNPEITHKPAPDFNKGKVPQFEIKALHDIAGKNADENALRPSEVKKLSGAPELVLLILSYENTNFVHYQQKRDIEDQIQSTQQRYYISTQGAVKDVDTLNQLNHAGFLQGLTERLSDAGVLSTLNNLYELGGAAKFEYFLTKALRAMPEERQEALHQRINDKLKPDQPHSHILISLKSVLEEIKPAPASSPSPRPGT